MNIPKHIIAVEDEAITQRFLKDLFAQHGIDDLPCFDNAADMLASLPTLECDLILMDINIHGPMDGIQLSRKILEKYDIPIVFMTAHSDDATVDEAIELSPYGFVCKPFTSKDILAAVKIAYKRYSKHTQVETKSEKIKNIVQITPKYHYCTLENKLYYANEAVKLTKKQHILIEMLVNDIGNAVDYQTLIYAVWEEERKSDSSLRTLIYSIRKLLPDLPIISDSGIGYTLKSQN